MHFLGIIKSVCALFVVLVVLLLLTTYHIYSLGQFDNVWPEIVGFCLDGIFFVLIFGLYQKWQERKRTEKAKTALKDTLSHFIKDFVWWLSVGAVQDMNTLSQKKGDTTYVIPIVNQAKAAIEALDKGYYIPAGMIDPVKRYGSKESIMLKCMLPIAAEIDDAHMKVWFDIIRSLDDIVEAENSQRVHSTSLYFLKKVVEFIEMP